MHTIVYIFHQIKKNIEPVFCAVNNSEKAQLNNRYGQKIRVWVTKLYNSNSACFPDRAYTLVFSTADSPSRIAQIIYNSTKCNSLLMKKQSNPIFRSRRETFPIKSPQSTFQSSNYKTSLPCPQKSKLTDPRDLPPALSVRATLAACS